MALWLPRGRSHRTTAEAWGSQDQHSEEGITGTGVKLWTLSSPLAVREHM